MSKTGDKPADFYVVGGTMNPEAPSYIERNADHELYEHILAGDFCCVLTPRQMGKSSMMARTADRLKKEGCRTAILDLSQIGTQKGKDSEEKWYYGITHSIVRELGLKTNLSAWWRDREKLPALQRLTEFFEDVLLPGTEGAVVIFVDEIDTTIALPFTDDFFAAVRACYNARATKSDYRRLNFVLLGVAGPSDLIKDTRRTPFNIGHRIQLTDFTLEEARPLARGLCTDQDQAMEILKRILYWSSGHPYLTQKLCSLAALEKMETYSEASVDALVEKHFLSPAANREEPNLKFVSQRLLRNKRAGRKLLLLYRRIYEGKTIEDDPLSPVQTELKLSGLVTAREDRRLAVRNRIYETAFNRQWINEVMPADWNRNIVAVAIVALLLGILGYMIDTPKIFIEAIRSAQEDVPNRQYERLRAMPFYKTKADDLMADYWERRALRSLSKGKRDDALLYRLQALKVKNSSYRRSEVAEIIGEDYTKLKATYRHFGPVSSVAFSADGKTLLTGSNDCTARLGDAATGKRLRILHHDSTVRSVAFSPDGKTILTGSGVGTARKWEAATGKLLTVMKHDDRVTSVAFSPDGKTLLTGSHDRTARLWDAATGKLLTVMKHDDRVTSVAFSPDGKTLLTGSHDRTARLWDAATGKQLAAMKHDLPVTSAAFSPDGKTLLTGSWDATARLWEVATGKQLAVMEHDGSVNSVFFSPDGKIILTGSSDKTARVWDAATGKQLAVMKHDYAVTSVAFSPDGKTLLTGSWDGTARLWEAATGKQLAVMKHDYYVTSVAFSTNGNTLLIGSGDGTARLWDAASGKQLAAMKHDLPVTSAAFSPDGKTLLTGSWDATARLWEVATGKQLAVMEHDYYVTSVAFSPDGKTLLTGSGAYEGGMARLWDAATGKSLAVMKHDDIVTSVAFSPDGKTLLIGSSDQTARLWDAATGKPLGPIMKHDLGLTSVAFSPDGKKVLTGCWDGLMQMWEVSTSKTLSSPMKYGSRIDFVAFSPDGKTIMAATDRWIHQSTVTGNTIKPKASRLLPGQWVKAYRFLDDRGDSLQAVVLTTDDSFKIMELRFDRPTAPPIQGDPRQLLDEWQKKLALKLDEKTGKIEPLYPLPNKKEKLVL